MLWLGGAAGPLPPDPLTATAPALDNGNDQAAMVSLDLISVSQKLMEGVRERLKTTLPELDARNLLLNATHTRTAPDVDGAYEIPAGVMTSAEYFDFLADSVTDTAVRAWRARRPAGVSWALGHAVIGYNRRASFADGRSVMYGPLARPDFLGFEGYEDHALEMLFFWTPDRKLTGIGINVACPAQALGRERFVSADFWHDARVELRRRYGDDLFVFPMIGAAGDQSPHVQLRQAAEAKMRERLGISVTGQIARRIAQAVEEVYPAAAEFPMELHVIRLGDVALATNPFELFLDFGLRMKARSRAELTFVIQLACSEGDYLPTAKAVAGGGYGAEIASNLVGPEGGQVLVDRTVALINSLFE